jgi:hypothetical protein
MAFPVSPAIGDSHTEGTTTYVYTTSGWQRTVVGVANDTYYRAARSITEGLDIPVHDYIACSYTGDNLTGVVYKTGGSGGTTVATLTLAYSGSQLTSVTKS